MSDFEKGLPLIVEIAVLSERMAAAGRIGTTVSELAERLRRPTSGIIFVFDVLGLVPRAWSDPENYAVEDIVEAAVRHEVGNRVNQIQTSLKLEKGGS